MGLQLVHCLLTDDAGARAAVLRRTHELAELMACDLAVASRSV